MFLHVVSILNQKKTTAVPGICLFICCLFKKDFSVLQLSSKAKQSLELHTGVQSQVEGA
jgi:hypothetical protein